MDRLATAYAVMLFVVVPLVVIFHALTEIAGPPGVLAAVLVLAFTLYAQGRAGGEA
jgi:hypothetical protein